MTLKDVMLKINNLEKNLLALVSRGYGDKAEKALSEAERVESKEDSAIEELDEGLAEAMLMIVDVMKGE